MKKPIFLRIYRDGQLLEVKQFKQDQISFGRSESVDVALEADGVSPIHAAIDERDNGYYLCDLGSEVGTRKNGMPILDEILADGDEITIGPFIINFYLGIPKPKGPPEKSGAAPAPETKKPKASAPAPESSQLDLPSEAPQVVARPREMAARDSTKEHRTQVVAPEKKGIAVERPKKGRWNTFAPESACHDLNSVIRPGKGPVIEVIIAWRERILMTRHFAGHKVVSLGSHPSNDIVCPALESLRRKQALFKIAGTTASLFLPADVQGEYFQGDKRTNFSDLQQGNILKKAANGYTLDLNQGEMVRIDYQAGLISIFVRFVSDCPRVLPAPFFLSPSELASVIISGVIALILGLYVSIYSPDLQEPEQPEPERIAHFVMQPPPRRYVTKPPPVQLSEKTSEKKIETLPPKPDPKPGLKTEDKPKEKPGAAAQAMPKPKDTSKQNVLTSPRKGGEVKVSPETGSTPKTVEKKVTEFGLLGVLSNKGVREKIDKQSSGAGDLVGLAAEKTGKAGLNKSRPGGDVGFAIKDVGKGGKGTATVGIGDINTKEGVGQGLSGTGRGGGLGDKPSVTIESGGEEEEFIGTIDREAVRRVVQKNLAQIKFCYEKSLRQRSSISGKVVFEWVIGDQGRVVRVKVKESNLGSREAEACMETQIKAWRFQSPPAGMEATVKFPFLLMQNN